MWRLSRCSPEARRSGRIASERDRRYYLSRSRSPRVCVTRALQESHGIKAIKWDVYCDDVDPVQELLADKADTLASIALREHRRLCSASPAFFYVGVSRYVRRRWRGGDNLPPEESHSQKWRAMYMLGTYSKNIGKIDDFVIERFKSTFGSEACANVKGRWRRYITRQAVSLVPLRALRER